MLSNVLFILFVCFLVTIVLCAIFDDIKKSKLICSYSENKDCDCFDEAGVPICENCEFYKLLNERN